MSEVDVSKTVNDTLDAIEKADLERKKEEIASKTRRLQQRIKTGAECIAGMQACLDKAKEVQAALEARLEKAKAGDVSALDDPKPSENSPFNVATDHAISRMLYSKFGPRFAPWDRL